MSDLTRPTGEQLRFRSTATGDHILDDYLEASEKGGRTLPDLLDDLFDALGNFIAGSGLYNWRGSYASPIPYVVGDTFKDPATQSIYVVRTNYTSTGNLATETATGKISVVFDASEIAIAIAEAQAAAAAATAAVATIDAPTIARTTTQVIAGAGLSGGGTLSADRTFNVGAGDGITVNADSIQVDTTVARTTRTLTAGAGLTGGGTLAADQTFDIGAGDGIQVNADSIQVDATVARSARTITAGAGLTGGGDLSADRTLNVGQGDGITVNADTIQVDATVVRTSGNQTIAGEKTLTDATVISLNSTSPGLRITQTGTGHVFLAEDAANPDSTPFVITAAGDVGIGTLTPQSLAGYGGLTFDGTQGGSILMRKAGTSIGMMYVSGANNLVLAAYNTSNLVFIAGGSTRMVIDDAGNVGIGTAPASVTGYTVLTLNNATNGGNIRFRNNGTTIGIIANTATVFSMLTASGTNANLHLGVNANTEIAIHGTRGNVGIGTTNPDASAELEVTSTTRGILIPRVTTTQRNAIASPVEGLLVYNTETDALERYTGSQWGDVISQTVYTTIQTNASNDALALAIALG